MATKHDPTHEDLTQLHLTQLQPRTSQAPQVPAEVAGNGAPAGEPEAWNANVAVYTPLHSQHAGTVPRAGFA